MELVSGIPHMQLINITPSFFLFPLFTAYLPPQDGFAKFFDDDKAREKALRDTVTDIVTSVCQFAVFGAGLAALACLLKR